MSELTELFKKARLIRLDFQGPDGTMQRNYGYASPNFLYTGPLVTLHSHDLFPEIVGKTQQETEKIRKHSMELVRRQLEFANNYMKNNAPVTENDIHTAIQMMRGNATPPNDLMDDTEKVFISLLEKTNNPIFLINIFRKKEIIFISDRFNCDDKGNNAEGKNKYPSLNDIVGNQKSMNANNESNLGNCIFFKDFNFNIYTITTCHPIFSWHNKNRTVNSEAIKNFSLTAPHEFIHGADNSHPDGSYSALLPVIMAINADTETTVERFKIMQALSFLKARSAEHQSPAERLQAFLTPPKHTQLYVMEIDRLNSPRYGFTYRSCTQIMKASVEMLTFYLLANRQLLYETLTILGEEHPSIAKALEPGVWPRFRKLCTDALHAIAREESSYQQHGNEQEIQQSIHREAIANFASITQEYSLQQAAWLFPKIYNQIYVETMAPDIAQQCQELCKEIGYSYTPPFPPPQPYEHPFDPNDTRTLQKLSTQNIGNEKVNKARYDYRDAIAERFLVNLNGATSATYDPNHPLALNINFGENTGAANIFTSHATANHISCTRSNNITNQITLTDYSAGHIHMAIAAYNEDRLKRFQYFCTKLIELKSMISPSTAPQVYQNIDSLGKIIDQFSKNLEKGGLGLRPDPENDQIRATKASDLPDGDTRFVDLNTCIDNLPIINQEDIEQIIFMIDAAPNISTSDYLEKKIRIIAEDVIAHFIKQSELSPEAQQLSHHWQNFR